VDDDDEDDTMHPLEQAADDALHGDFSGLEALMTERPEVPNFFGPALRAIQQFPVRGNLTRH
jgi:hypothetical protein